MSDLYKKFYAANDEFRTGKISKAGLVVTPLARFSYVQNLHKPSKPPKAPAEQEEKYSIMLLLPKEADLTLIKNAIQEAGVKKFGPAEKWPRRANGELMIDLPIHDQGDKVGSIYVPGAKYITPGRRKSFGKPDIIDAKGKPITDESKVYSGCWGWVTLSFYAYDEPRQGVGIGLTNVQVLGDDEPLGYTAPAASDEFAAIEVPLTGAALQAAGAGSIFE